MLSDWWPIHCRFIAEDPSCPAHGMGGLADQLEEAEDIIRDLRGVLSRIHDEFELSEELDVEIARLLGQ